MRGSDGDEIALTELPPIDENARTVNFGAAKYPSVLDPWEPGLTIRHYDRTIHLDEEEFRGLRHRITDVFDPTIRNNVQTSEYDNVRNEEFEEPALAQSDDKKFGTWDGVFANCLLNVFGVIMFLRLGWIVGKAGWLLTFAIIGLAGLVIVLTTLSMSAIATNG
ncbi:MAG: hypothetical protein MHM6MM_009067, partial [Cercozoa sp. M6MM]